MKMKVKILGVLLAVVSMAVFSAPADAGIFRAIFGRSSGSCGASSSSCGASSYGSCGGASYGYGSCGGASYGACSAAPSYGSCSPASAGYGACGVASASYGACSAPTIDYGISSGACASIATPAATVVRAKTPEPSKAYTVPKKAPPQYALWSEDERPTMVAALW